MLRIVTNSEIMVYQIKEGARSKYLVVDICNIVNNLCYTRFTCKYYYREKPCWCVFVLNRCNVNGYMLFCTIFIHYAGSLTLHVTTAML
jgi:hypothetical protein